MGSFDVSFISIGEVQSSSSVLEPLLVRMPIAISLERSRPTRTDMRCLTSALCMLTSSSVRLASGERLASGCGRQVVRLLKYSGNPVSRSRSDIREGLSGGLGMVSEDDQPLSDALYNVRGLRMVKYSVFEVARKVEMR